MAYTKLRTRNIYAIPVGDYFDKPAENCLLLYSPLANQFTLATPDEVDKLEQLAEQGNMHGSKVLQSMLQQTLTPKATAYNKTESLQTAYLLLNEKCNMHCSYCYSAGGRSKAELGMKDIAPLLEFLLQKREGQPDERVVMFIGGGEPTLSWTLLKETTAYAEQLAQRNGVKVQFRITTNGLLVTDEMVAWYKAHNFAVQFSFEVLEDIQNTQRGQFQTVSHNLKRLLAAGVECKIRSTITADNVDRMCEMVEICHREYPGVYMLDLEDVVDSGYFTSPAVVRAFYDRYFHSYNNAGQLAEQYGINIQSATYKTIHTIREKFCSHMVCLTPYKTMTTCAFVSTPNENGYDEAVIGVVEDGEVRFDMSAYDRLTKQTIHNVPECKDCWAKWNCGSGCPNQRRVYSADIYAEICQFAKRTLRHNLMEEMQKRYAQQTGRDLLTDLKDKIDG